MKSKCEECEIEFEPEGDAKGCDACAKKKATDSQDTGAQSQAPAAVDLHHHIDGFYGFTPDGEEEAEEWGYIKRFVKNDAGFLVGKACVTNVGVFSYQMPDGSISRQFRPPEEVFNHESLESLKGAVLTNEHPIQDGKAILVTAENVKEVGVGFVSGDIDHDALRIYTPLAVTHADVIAEVEDGKRGLSCGYTCKHDETPGNFMGVEYDLIQREIRYNHIAVVTKGRAGDAAVLKLDGVDMPVGQLITSNPKKEQPMKHTIKVDSVDIEVSEQVKSHVDSLTLKLDSAEKKATEAEAKADSAKEELETVKAKMDEMPKAIEAAVSARLALVAQADGLGVKVTAAQSDSDIKNAVIKQAFPKADDEKLKDESYANARFDAAVELLTTNAEQHADSAAASNAAVGTKVADAVVVDSAKAQADYESRTRNAWQSPAK